MEYKTTRKLKHIVVEAKVNHDTQFYRIKDGVGLPIGLPPIPNNF